MYANKQQGWAIGFWLIASALITSCSATATKNVMPATPIVIAEQTRTPALTTISPPSFELTPTTVPTTFVSISPEPTSTVALPTLSLANLKTEFPLTLNNIWLYQATRYEGFNSRDIMTTTQLITETVIDVKTTSSYVAAKIHQETSADLPMFVPKELEKMLRAATSSDYWLVLSGNRLYYQEDKLDLSTLDEALLKFVFPLEVGATWYQVDTGLSRQVTKVGSVSVPAGQFENCFLLQEKWPGVSYQEWFCPKVGIVEQKGDHLGTPGGLHKVLIRYQLEE
ncbi:MAG: hypothetical protein HY741_20680 [Chloroflexi bacterium]|nr:hypothetical protein [Chloroflexota bacterium]